MRDHHYKLDAETIKESIDPYDFYAKEQNLCRYGYRSGQWAVAGLCPFHEDGSDGTFKINLESGGFICFSCGAKGGDIISYLQKRDNLSFREVLEQLAVEWRVS